MDAEQNWMKLFQSYKQSYPELAEQLTNAIDGKSSHRCERDTNL
ncbi:hypothetical protein GCM10020331_065540 [Ectobacillus funiculus]